MCLCFLKISIFNLRHAMPLMDDSPKGGTRINANTYFLNKDIDEAVTLNPFSHIYMFDVGFTPELH